MTCLAYFSNERASRHLLSTKIMRILGFYFVLYIAVCRADEDTQNNDQGIFPQDLQEFVRRLTQQQMMTTQNLQSSLLPRLNLPLLRSRMENRPQEESPLPLLNFPFQSTNGAEAGSHSRASASVSVKRPHEGDNLESRASAYASVKDVDDEEHLGEDIVDSDDTTTKGHIKPTSAPERLISGSMDGDAVTKGEPYALKHQRPDTVLMKADESFSDIYFVAIVAGCCAVGIFGVISAGICFYKLQKSRKAAADVDYPAYGVTGPNKDLSSPNGDRKLAQSAQMYHYQHQKQQMIAVEKAGSTKNTSASDVDSEEENEEGDYTVYECPGLASTGEMEVKNPLFHDDSTPVSPPVLPSKPDSNLNN